MIATFYRKVLPSRFRAVIYKLFLSSVLSHIRFSKKKLRLLFSRVDNIPEKKANIIYLRRHFLDITPMELMLLAPFAKKYSLLKHEVYFDYEASLYYTIFKGKRLYWKKNMKVKHINTMFSSLLAEQDDLSPHRYFDDSFSFQNKTIFDIGAAEGIIVLDHIEEIKHAYLFECDEEWINALSVTFGAFKDKVTIIPKYVSNKKDEMNITIDQFCSQFGVVPDIIKMDIEGYEVRALQGAIDTIIKNNVFIACCIYHLPSDEDNIVNFLSGLNCNCSIVPGFLYPTPIANTGAPYLRRGVVRAFKNDCEDNMQNSL